MLRKTTVVFFFSRKNVVFLRIQTTKITLCLCLNGLGSLGGRSLLFCFFNVFLVSSGTPMWGTVRVVAVIALTSRGIDPWPGDFHQPAKELTKQKHLSKRNQNIYTKTHFKRQKKM